MQRLDKYLFEKGFFPSREKASQAIKNGLVFVNGKSPLSSTKVDDLSQISIKQEVQYVSRGAFKLLGAKQKFGLDFKDKTVLDIGASTGGFTQVCLEGGAKKVYALDVGEGQLSEKLRANPQVVDLSKTDFRFAPKFDDVDFVVSDISFISLRHIVPKLVEQYKEKEIVLLFKPQFECGPVEAKKHAGVVRNKSLHKKLIEDFVKYISFFGFVISGFDYSPIVGKSGNIEYLFYLNGSKKARVNFAKVIDKAFENL